MLFKYCVRIYALNVSMVTVVESLFFLPQFLMISFTRIVGINAI